MDAEQIRKEAIAGTRYYLNYLRKSGKSVTCFRIAAPPVREEGLTVLRPCGTLQAPEDVLISIKGQLLPPDTARIASYSEEKGLLRIECQAALFAGLKAGDVMLHANLIFLTERVLKWYEEHPLLLTLRRPPQDSPPQIPDYCSHQQREAIRGVLTEPYTYIWGPPGSGKTRCVMATAIENLLRQGRRVLLSAPTNCALEQALSGVLEELGPKGLDLRGVLRLGTPSAKFRERYGAVCQEPTDLPRPGILTAEVRLPAVHLLAGTPDSLIGRMGIDGVGGFVPSHVFLDEAAYCPLAKALPLFNLGAPMTLLGDHKQLPPVCVMDRQTLAGSDAAPLWAMSALYADQALTLPTMLALSGHYFADILPPMTHFKQYNLTQSYRYGAELAEILSETLYGGALSSAISRGTEIIVLSVPAGGGKTAPRTSPGEARVIADYLRSHPGEDFAVLTPYCNQLTLLRKLIPKAQQENRLLTVHGAQSREWDTVVLSVVDTSDKYFTDSCCKSSHGSEVMNTAVSRAKKRLVIVCDADYWQSQPRQLLCKLITAGRAA